MPFFKTLRTVCKQFLAPNFFFSHVLTPLIVLLSLCLLVSHLFPPGVNRVFATRMVRYLTPVVICACLIFLILALLKKCGFGWLGIPNAKPNRNDKDFDARVLTLLLFPLAPVVQYVLSNTSLLSWWDGIIVIALFVLMVSFPILILPLLFRKIAAARSVTAVGVAFTALIMNMASLSRQFAWHTTGSLKIQLPLLVLLWFVLWLSFLLKQERNVYLFVVLFFVVGAITPLFNRQETTFTSGASNHDFRTENPLFRALYGRTIRRMPSVYLLVYDSYPASEAITAYRLDNRAQEEFLKERGFKLYPQAYSVAAHTTSSISFVLNCALEYYGSDRRALAGDGVVQNIFHDHGYTTYGVFASDYFFWENAVPSYDYFFPRSETSMALLLARSILEGEFRFDVSFAKVSYEQFLQEKARVLAEVSDTPRFVYAHSKWPGHSQNSGACLPNETDLFAERLAMANAEMKSDIEWILDRDPGAIIILAGDHGPYLTKNCTGTGFSYDISEINRLDVQDRFSVLLAIRWPSPDFEAYDEITILQDLFPAIFAYLFEDENLLQTRLEPVTVEKHPISGVVVRNGILYGGVDDGEPLFLGESGHP